MQSNIFPLEGIRPQVSAMYKVRLADTWISLFDLTKLLLLAKRSLQLTRFVYTYPYLQIRE